MGTCHGVQGISNIGGKLLGKGLMVKPDKCECPKLHLLLLVYCISPHMGHWLSKGSQRSKKTTDTQIHLSSCRDQIQTTNIKDAFAFLKRGNIIRYGVIVLLS